MRPSSFLRRYRSAGQPPVHTERVLAVGRAFLTATGFVAVYLDPTEPTRLQALTYGVLLAYVAYSLTVLAYVHAPVRLTWRHGRILHGLDLAWTSALTYVSQGPVSPFFLFFLFVVLAAAYRGGIRETIGTAVIVAAVVIGEAVIAAAGPAGFDLNGTILRVGYLVVTGALLGYLAEQEKQSRAELAAIADATRQPRVNLGLGGSIAALSRMLLAAFEALAGAVVIRDHATGRTLLWHVEPGPAGAPPRVRRSELGAPEHDAWLFPDFGRAWHASPLDGTEPVVRVLTTDTWALERRTGRIPDAVTRDRSGHTLTAVNMGLSGEWHGRIYLYDVARPRDPERSLHFLDSLMDHVTPALTNVFLLRRLRARAGAAERARVARELHDGAIQALFGIEMKLEAFKRSPDRSPGFVDREVGDVQELLRREVLSLRELMQTLRPIDLEGADQLPEVLASVVERFRRDTGIAARFVSSGSGAPLSQATAIEAVRIVQEALVNVRRHSEARNVLVSLVSDDAACRLVIEDDGRGFPFEGRLSDADMDEHRIGPATIRERARIAGATLTIDSSPQAGARIELAFAGDHGHG
jgi:signal transduction histidine kinase